MSSCGFNFKIWSLIQQQVSDKNLSFTSYHDKETKDSLPVSDIGVEKRSFLLSRNQTWTPRNKRPNKLREHLKILEATFQSNAVVKFSWKTPRQLKIIFNNALIVDLELSSENDISKIHFNKSLAGKLQTSTITSAGVGEHFIAMTFLDSSQIAFMAGKSETKPFIKSIPGPLTKEVKRIICLNPAENLLICWWKFGSQLQNIPETDQINIVLIDASTNRFDVVSTLLTEEDLFDLQFSKTDASLFLTLERPLIRKSASLNSVIYEISNQKITRLKVTSLPLKSGVLSASRNSDESKLLVGCSDGKLLLYDVITGDVIHMVVRAPIVPNHVIWLDDGMMVASGTGEIVLYDGALNQFPLSDLHCNQYSQLQLYEHLSSGNGLAELVTCQSTIGNNQILIFFNGGPLSTLHLYGRLNNERFVKSYLNDAKAKEAIDVLRTIDWNIHDNQAFYSLTAIADEILKEPLSHDTEEFLQRTFATFYSPRKPIDDHIVLKYRLSLGCYLRRFFHHLLRYMRFEQAFMLAKDISSSELFLDIHFAAKDIGEINLARIAKRKADELAAEENAENGLNEEDEHVRIFDKLNFHYDPNDQVDHLEIAIRNQLNTSSSASTKGKSTLKVMNLGYV